MEDLIGRKVKVTMSNQYGIVVVTGILMKIVEPFIVMMMDQKEVYFSLYFVKMIELS